MAKWANDLVLGASGNSGRGFEKISFTSGGTLTPAVGDILTGATSGARAIIMQIVHTIGTWAGGNEVGTIHTTYPTVATHFANGEDLNLSGSQTQLNICTTSGASVVDAKLSSYPTVAAGDTIYHAKTSPVTDTGVTASITKGSRTMTLSSPLNQTLCDCSTTTGWTTYLSASVALGTTCKEGTNGINLTFPASVSGSTRYAYFDIGADQNLNIYQWLEFFFSLNSGANIQAGDIVIKLLDNSDNVLSTFTMQGWASTCSANVSFDSGGALSTIVRRIGIYSGSSVSTRLNSRVLSFDMFTVSKAANVKVKSLVSFQSNAMIGASDYWYPVKYINGTTLEIDNHAGCLTGTGRGFAQATVTNGELYFRDPVQTTTPGTSTSTAYMTTPVAGTVDAQVINQGGVNPYTLDVDGETISDGINGYGWMFSVSSRDYNVFDRFVSVRWFRMFNEASTNIVTQKNCVIIGNSSTNFGAVFHYWDGNHKHINCAISCFQTSPIKQLSGKVYVVGCLDNTVGGANIGGKIDLMGLEVYNCAGYGYTQATDTTENSVIMNYVSADNALDKSIYHASTNGTTYFDGFTASEGTPVTILTTSPYNQMALFIKKYGGTTGDDRCYQQYATRIMQTTEKPAFADVAHAISVTNALRKSKWPYMEKIGSFQVTANNLCTFKVLVKNSSTSIVGGLYVSGNRIAGVAEQTVVNTNTTDWTDGNALTTLTCTPTEDGWIDLYMVAYASDAASTYTSTSYIASPEGNAGGNHLFTQA